MAGTLGEGATGYAAKYVDALKNYGNTDATWNVANLANGGSGLATSTYKNWVGANSNAMTDANGNVTNSTVETYRPYYTVNTGSDPTAPGTITTTPLPEEGDQYMSYSEALQRAQNRLNPTYNSSRNKLEQAYSQQREQIPQVLAARYGMSGTRGGRAQSAQYGATQAENIAVSDIEAQRESAINELADSIYNSDYQKAIQRYQLEADANKTEYQSLVDAYKTALAKKQYEDATNREIIQNMIDNTRTASNDAWTKQKDERDYTADQGWKAKDYEQKVKEWAASPESQSWYLPLTKADVEAGINAKNRSNTGGSGGGGLTAFQIYQIQQQQLADQKEFRGANSKSIQEQIKKGATRDELINNTHKEFEAGMMTQQEADEIYKMIDAYSPYVAPVVDDSPGYFWWLK